MNSFFWCSVLATFFVTLVPNVLLKDIIDPFDMRDYDPKTKKMITASSIENSLTDSHKCSECSSYLQKYCELSSVCKYEVKRQCKNWEESKESQKTAMLNTFLMRFVNVLLKKSRLQDDGPDNQESLLSFKLSRHQLRVLKYFGESGDASLLQDVNEILSMQIDLYNPPLCAEDYIQRIYEAKEFFSESTFIILGIVLTAAVFFYNVFVLNKIRVALLSLTATIFFSGYFWTYWKMYEDLMADLVRQSRHGEISDCYPHTEYFLWIFSYTVPADIKKCKEYYNARHTRPLSKLTPTLVFFETMKIFWGGFLQELGEIVISLFRELMDHSPWYIKWTVLPLVFIFVLVCLIVCIAFLTGKRFKLSHPIFGAIELDTDLNYQQSKVTKDEIAYKVVRSSTDLDSNLSCLTCGTTFVQATAISAQRVVITQTVAEKAENTDPEHLPSSTANSSQRNRLRNRAMKTGLTFIQKAIVSPLRQIMGSKASDGERTVTDGGPSLPVEYFYPNEESDDADTIEECVEDDAKDSAEDSEEDHNLVTLENDSDEDKENVVLCSAYSHQMKPSATEIWHLKRSPAVKEPLSLAKFNSKSSPALLSPGKAQNSEPKKKYFEEIKFAKSPDPKEKRLIPIILSEPGTSSGSSGDMIATERVNSVFQENLVRSGEKYFAESNERIKKQLSFRQVSARLFSKNGSQAVELEVQNEQRISQHTVHRKLSL